MKHAVVPRLVAMLLALAILFSMTSLAEAVLPEDILPGDDEVLILEDEALELSDDIVDINLEAGLDDLVMDLESDALLSDPVSDAGEAKAEEAANATRIVLGVKEKYALDAEAIGSGKKVTFKSSNKKIATVTSKGVIKGKKKGSASITCRVSGKKVATYKVKVVSAPKKVTLDKSSVTLGVKESFTMTPSIPDGTHASFTWSVKDKSVARVSKTGKITGKKVGKTTVTVKTQNGVKASVTVKVKKAPDDVWLDRISAKVKVNGTLQLKATLPDDTYSAITWSSNKPTVAKVSDKGKVTGLAAGTATITAKTFNGYTATCKVEVGSGGDGEVKYRALLIGEVKFYGEDSAYRNGGDVAAMADMLKNVTGYYGGKYSITQKYNLTAVGTMKAIEKTFADADEDDVSLFFIATHGDVMETGDYAGALAMTSDGDLLLKDLANFLKAVPGKVIVILESCGSGAAVYARNSSNSSNKKAAFEEAKARADAFDAAVIRAFANVDTGVIEPVQGYAPNAEGVQANTGEFRVANKFYVLAASRYQELSWGWETGRSETSYNYFTLWLTEGIGLVRRTDGDGFDMSDSMPADVNNNGKTSLNELYQYIVDVGNDYPFRQTDGTYYQHVQVYPKNSKYVLFCR